MFKHRYRAPRSIHARASLAFPTRIPSAFDEFATAVEIVSSAAGHQRVISLPDHTERVREVQSGPTNTTSTAGTVMISSRCFERLFSIRSARRSEALRLPAERIRRALRDFRTMPLCTPDRPRSPSGMYFANRDYLLRVCARLDHRHVEALRTDVEVTEDRRPVVGRDTNHRRCTAQLGGTVIRSHSSGSIGPCSASMTTKSQPSKPSSSTMLAEGCFVKHPNTTSPPVSRALRPLVTIGSESQVSVSRWLHEPKALQRFLST